MINKNSINFMFEKYNKDGALLLRLGNLVIIKVSCKIHIESEKEYV